MIELENNFYLDLEIIHILTLWKQGPKTAMFNSAYLVTVIGKLLQQLLVHKISSLWWQGRLHFCSKIHQEKLAQVAGSIAYSSSAVPFGWQCLNFAMHDSKLMWLVFFAAPTAFRFSHHIPIKGSWLLKLTLFLKNTVKLLSINV